MLPTIDQYILGLKKIANSKPGFRAGLYPLGKQDNVYRRHALKVQRDKKKNLELLNGEPFIDAILSVNPSSLLKRIMENNRIIIKVSGFRVSKEIGEATVCSEYYPYRYYPLEYQTAVKRCIEDIMLFNDSYLFLGE